MPLPDHTWVFIVALSCALVAVVATAVRPAGGRVCLTLGVLLHLGGTVDRGVAIGFFPLTNKFESFSAASLALALVTLATWRPARAYVVPRVGLVAVLLAVALRFPTAPQYPNPLIYTRWYPLHVPLSFLAYGLWTAAAAAGLAARTAEDWDREWLARVNRYSLQGFGLWSLSMIFGGIWGVVAWGAYFLWDPKVIWSVILWFHYATFVHIRHMPWAATRPWVRPVLAWVGLAFVFVAYVGTSFFFGRSAHAF